MNQETLKRIRQLYDKWVNDSQSPRQECEIASEVMEHLPDLLAAVKELDAAQRACAEMRTVLSETFAFVNDMDVVRRLQHTLSTNCGKDYVHKSEREKAEAACAEMRDVLNFLNNTVLDEVKVGGCCQCNTEAGDNPCGYCATVDSASQVEHALSPDCGRGYFPERDVLPLVALAKKLDAHLAGAGLLPTRDEIKTVLAHWEKVKK